MRPDPRISLITLGVADLARARTFYERGLGWKVSSASQGDIVFFALGPVALALYPRPLLAQDAGVGEQGGGFRGLSLAHNVRAREQVDQVLAQAESAGARIVRAAHDAEWGGRSGYFADADGHLWEVAWNPNFGFDEAGGLVLPD